MPSKFHTFIFAKQESDSCYQMHYCHPCFIRHRVNSRCRLHAFFRFSPTLIRATLLFESYSNIASSLKTSGAGAKPVLFVESKRGILDTGGRLSIVLSMVRSSTSRLLYRQQHPRRQQGIRHWKNGWHDEEIHVSTILKLVIFIVHLSLAKMFAYWVLQMCEKFL